MLVSVSELAVIRIEESYIACVVLVVNCASLWKWVHDSFSDDNSIYMWKFGSFTRFDHASIVMLHVQFVIESRCGYIYFHNCIYYTCEKVHVRRWFHRYVVALRISFQCAQARLLTVLVRFGKTYDVWCDLTIGDAVSKCVRSFDCNWEAWRKLYRTFKESTETENILTN